MMPVFSLVRPIIPPCKAGRCIVVILLKWCVTSHVTKKCFSRALNEHRQLIIMNKYLNLSRSKNLVMDGSACTNCQNQEIM